MSRRLGTRNDLGLKAWLKVQSIGEGQKECTHATDGSDTGRENNWSAVEGSGRTQKRRVEEDRDRRPYPVSGRIISVGRKDGMEGDRGEDGRRGRRRRPRPVPPPPQGDQEAERLARRRCREGGGQGHGDEPPDEPEEDVGLPRRGGDERAQARGGAEEVVRLPRRRGRGGAGRPEPPDEPEAVVRLARRGGGERAQA
ncbi:hypothetical protein THAOC_18354, partial [Thalassiosira oceanica]